MKAGNFTQNTYNFLDKKNLNKINNDNMRFIIQVFLSFSLFFFPYGNVAKNPFTKHYHRLIEEDTEFSVWGQRILLTFDVSQVPTLRGVTDPTNTRVFSVYANSEMKWNLKTAVIMKPKCVSNKNKQPNTQNCKVNKGKLCLF